MEGARWDVQAGIIMESKLKELFPSMPVIYVRVRNICFIAVIFKYPPMYLHMSMFNYATLRFQIIVFYKLSGYNSG